MNKSIECPACERKSFNYALYDHGLSVEWSCGTCGYKENESVNGDWSVLFGIPDENEAIGWKDSRTNISYPMAEAHRNKGTCKPYCNVLNNIGVGMFECTTCGYIHR